MVCLGTLIALFLQRRFFGSQIVRSIVLLPWVLPGAISAVLWIWVFHPSFGVLNGLLRDLHLIDHSIPWLTSPRLALISVVVAHVWTQIPFAVVLVMAALSAINSETLEAAAIDCRSALKRFRYIVFPEIKSMIVVLDRLQRADRLHELRPRLRHDRRRARARRRRCCPSRSGAKASRCTISASGSAVAFIVVAISAVLILAITRALPSDLFASD